MDAFGETKIKQLVSLLERTFSIEYGELPKIFGPDYNSFIDFIQYCAKKNNEEFDLTEAKSQATFLYLFKDALYSPAHAIAVSDHVVSLDSPKLIFNLTHELIHGLHTNQGFNRDVVLDNLYLNNLYSENSNNFPKELLNFYFLASVEGATEDMAIRFSTNPDISKLFPDVQEYALNRSIRYLTKFIDPDWNEDFDIIIELEKKPKSFEITDIMERRLEEMAPLVGYANIQLQRFNKRSHLDCLNNPIFSIEKTVEFVKQNLSPYTIPKPLPYISRL